MSYRFLTADHFRLVLSRMSFVLCGVEGWFHKRVKMSVYPTEIYCINTIKQSSLRLEYRKACKLSVGPHNMV